MLRRTTQVIDSANSFLRKIGGVLGPVRDRIQPCPNLCRAAGRFCARVLREATMLT
jgi:hypothetical protein